MRSKHEPAVQYEPTFIEAARRAQIIQCAVDTIANLGYERASLAEIARRAKVSKSVISYYFAGKEQLIRQVVDAVYAEGAAFMVPRVQTSTSASEALRAYISANITFMDGHRNHMLALVEIVSSYRDAEGRSMFDASAQERIVGELETLLQWGQQSGEFRTFSTQVMAVAIRAAIDALPPRIALYPDMDLDSYAEELADLFERAVKQPSRRRGVEP